MDEFVIKSNGHCFLCLNQISPEVAQEDDDVPNNSVEGDEVVKPSEPSSSVSVTTSTSSIYSLQCLCRHLKMDLRKAFNGRTSGSGSPISINQFLLGRMERSKWKVELCAECDQLGEEFSGLYKQLEIIGMQVGTCLSRIHGKLARAEEEGRIAELFQRMTKEDLQNQQYNLDNSSSEDEEEGSMEQEMKIVEVLRTETMKKCSKKLKTTLPRVTVKNLAEKDTGCEYSFPDSESDIELDDNDEDADDILVLSSDDDDQVEGQVSDSDEAMDFENDEVEEEDPGSDIEIIQEGATPKEPPIIHDISDEDDDSEVEIIQEEVVPLPQPPIIHESSDGDSSPSNPEEESEPLLESVECDICHLPVNDLSHHLLTAHCETGMKVEENISATPPMEEEELPASRCHPPLPLPTTSNHLQQISLYSPKSQSRKYVCDICCYTFPSRQARWDHQRTKHKGKKFSCDYCHLLFNTTAGRLQHMRYKCPNIIVRKQNYD